MGEIDRINPILRPVIGPRTTDRIQPGGERGRQHEDRDRLELHDRADEEADAEAEHEEPKRDGGLDLSI